MKTLMQTTSLDAYSQIDEKGLGRQQQEVLDVILKFGDICNNETAKYLGIPINCITGRVNELTKLGIIEDKGKRKSRVTGINSIAWGIKDES